MLSPSTRDIFLSRVVPLCLGCAKGVHGVDGKHRRTTFFFGAMRDIVLIDGECGTVFSLAMRDKSDLTVNTGPLQVPCCPNFVNAGCLCVPCCPCLFGLSQQGVHGVDWKYRRTTFFWVQCGNAVWLQIGLADRPQ